MMFFKTFTGKVIQILDNTAIVEKQIRNVYCRDCDSRRYCIHKKSHSYSELCPIEETQVTIDITHIPDLRVGDRVEQTVPFTKRVLADFVLFWTPDIIQGILYYAIDITYKPFRLWSYVIWLPFWLVLVYYVNKWFAPQFRLIGRKGVK